MGAVSFLPGHLGAASSARTWRREGHQVTACLLWTNKARTSASTAVDSDEVIVVPHAMTGGQAGGCSAEMEGHGAPPVAPKAGLLRCYLEMK